MRAALLSADTSILTVPMEKVSWIKRQMGNPYFIPVGANLPPLSRNSLSEEVARDGKLSITVFGITGGESGRNEIREIGSAVRYAASRLKNLRLIVLGRNSNAAERELRAALCDCGVELNVLGLLPAADVVSRISASDVLLFVRGHISTRRGSAIAGIACGVPVVAFEGPETAAPITEAGLAVYSRQREGHLCEVLVSVLEDERYRAALADRSLLAQRKYFSWSAIASQYAELLRRAQ
jgi:glycosyltransferase involved in cell wall biosynthesis